MTAHLPLERIAEGLARHGVEGRIHPGAQGRSARAYFDGYSRGCQANVIHHTASAGNPSDVAFLIGGRGDGYVIANAFAPADIGGIDLIASGPTYTEGRGGPRGLIPSGGANRVANSIEIGNRGDGVDRYDDAQQRAVIAWAAVCGELAAELWGWHDDPYGPDRLFSHFEWSPGRKIDPKGPSRWAPDGGLWDMDAFRADARIANALSKPPTDHHPEGGDMKPHLWKHKNHKATFYVEGAAVLHIDGKEAAALIAAGVPTWESTNDDVYQSRMYLHGGPVPAWVKS